MSLLSTKDYNVLASALRRGREITLERSLGAVHLTARTVPVGPPWDVPMVLEIRVERHPYSWIQNFKSVEDARRYGGGIV